MFSENTRVPLVETLPYISPYLIDYYLKLFKHFKTKVNTKLNIRYSSFETTKIVELGLRKEFIGEEWFMTVVISKY